MARPGRGALSCIGRSDTRGLRAAGEAIGPPALPGRELRDRSQLNRVEYRLLRCEVRGRRARVVERVDHKALSTNVYNIDVEGLSCYPAVYVPAKFIPREVERGRCTGTGWQSDVHDLPDMAMERDGAGTGRGPVAVVDHGFDEVVHGRPDRRADGPIAGSQWVHQEVLHRVEADGDPVGGLVSIRPDDNPVGVRTPAVRNRDGDLHGKSRIDLVAASGE